MRLEARITPEPEIAGVLANDTDAEGDSLFVELITPPANGELTLNPDGTFEYTSDAGFVGLDTFQYRASDDDLPSNVATVRITVIPAMNRPPDAVDDAYAVDEESEISVDAAGGVLANDSDPQGDPITAAVVSQPQHGSLTFNADGSFRYTPEMFYFGDDSFTYRANDGFADSRVATVTITVRGLPDPPVAIDDSYTIDEGETLVTNVLANDIDVDDDVLTATLVSDVAFGMLTFNSDGTFTYVPNLGFIGTDMFTYRANDGVFDSSVATAFIEIRDVNAVPRTVGDTYVVDEDGILSVDAAGGVLANDTDAEGEPLTAAVASQPPNGTLSLAADGSFTYTPNANFFGTDTFTYRASDGESDSPPTLVTITVNSVQRRSGRRGRRLRSQRGHAACRDGRAGGGRDADSVWGDVEISRQRVGPGDGLAKPVVRRFGLGERPGGARLRRRRRGDGRRLRSESGRWLPGIFWRRRRQLHHDLFSEHVHDRRRFAHRGRPARELSAATTGSRFISTGSRSRATICDANAGSYQGANSTSSTMDRT